MSELIIKNVNIVLIDSILENATITCKDNKITELSKNKSNNTEGTIDGKGHFLIPGLIDLHIHGVGKYLVDNGKQALESICSKLPEYFSTF